MKLSGYLEKESLVLDNKSVPCCNVPAKSFFSQPGFLFCRQEDNVLTGSVMCLICRTVPPYNKSIYMDPGRRQGDSLRPTYLGAILPIRGGVGSWFFMTVPYAEVRGRASVVCL